ncbi:MAG: transaldolase [Candidatus Omnitrophica bacterium]|nr:transaldolase [Candidatus Omnitrophota bacterium]
MTQKTKIRELHAAGQSIWLDYISRSLIETGELALMIEQGLTGMTSNPTIFETTITTSTAYDRQIQELRSAGKSAFEIYDELTVKDIRDAADLFLPVYETTGGRDGYVSLEINPRLAFDVKKTVAEGERLYHNVNRSNLMLKVPATPEGFQAIEILIGRKMNVNATLIFSMDQYINTMAAYLAGVNKLIKNGDNPRTVRSVASVFVSRIDTICDQLLDEKIHEVTSDLAKEALCDLKGKAAIANATVIYGKFHEITSSDEFLDLINQGVNIQRVLWGSTSTKNAAYSDLKYVTGLTGKHTINTMPRSTYEAFLDHGTTEPALTAQADEAQKIIDAFQSIGIDVTDVCERLLEDGVDAFNTSFTALLQSLEHKMTQLCKA